MQGLGVGGGRGGLQGGTVSLKSLLLTGQLLRVDLGLIWARYWPSVSDVWGG